MSRTERGVSGWRLWIAGTALAALAVVLYARTLALGLIGDDYTLLDAARRFPLAELLTGRHGIIGFYRPLSRELYFWGWGRVLGLGAGGFHLVNAVTYVAVVVLLWRFLARWLGSRAGLLGAAAFVLFPPTGAWLSWVSCAQDLIALLWGVAALELYRGGRHRLAGVAAACAALSKETAAIMPLALAAFEWVAGDRRLATRERASRLLPSFVGVGVAAAIGVAARTTWAPGTAVALWSPAQALGAWALPVDFLSSFWPPSTVPGLAQAWHASGPLLAVIVLLAMLAVPAAAAGRGKPAAAPARDRAHARPAVPPLRPALVFGVALAVLGMFPVAFIIGRWRAYFFGFAALGTSVIAGALLARLEPWPSRVLLALAALIDFGSNSAYVPIAGASGPARHAHANYAFFLDMNAFTQELLQQLEPWCGALRSVPRTFTTGVPRTFALDNVLGPGLRVACRDTVARLHPIEEFTPADAAAPFGLLAFDTTNVTFGFQLADAGARHRLGVEFVVHRRYLEGAACLEAAVAERPGDPALAYPRAVAMAATGARTAAAEAWRAAVAQGLSPTPERLAARLTGRASPPGPAAADTARRALVAAARGVLADPAAADAHAALGRRLLALGRAREAAFELAAAWGLSARPADLATLAAAYVAMGDGEDARAAFEQALAGGLPPELAERARAQLRALGPAPVAIAP